MKMKFKSLAKRGAWQGIQASDESMTGYQLLLAQSSDHFFCIAFLLVAV